MVPYEGLETGKEVQGCRGVAAGVRQQAVGQRGPVPASTPSSHQVEHLQQIPEPRTRERALVSSVCLSFHTRPSDYGLLTPSSNELNSDTTYLETVSGPTG